MKAPFEHEILGKTRDDAAGEAFDKIGKVFGLEYPAGPTMDKLAKEGNPKFHKFPQALLKEGLDFSFSGLKTSALYFVQAQEEGFVDDNLNDLCASVSEAITEVLVKKLKRAVEQTGVRTIALAGGVSANSMLRTKTEALAKKMGLALHIPKITYCTDNAAMIAITGKMKAELGEFDGMELKPFASL